MRRRRLPRNRLFSSPRQAARKAYSLWMSGRVGEVHHSLRHLDVDVGVVDEVLGEPDSVRENPHWNKVKEPFRASYRAEKEMEGRRYAVVFAVREKQELMDVITAFSNLGYVQEH